MSVASALPPRPAGQPHLLLVASLTGSAWWVGLRKGTQGVKSSMKGTEPEHTYVHT